MLGTVNTEILSECGTLECSEMKEEEGPGEKEREIGRKVNEALETNEHLSD